MMRGEIMGAVTGWSERVRVFLDGYGRALSAGDAQSVAAHWDVPALVLDADETLAANATPDLERFCGGAVERFRRGGPVRAEPRWIEAEGLGERVVSADVTWVVSDRGVVRGVEQARYLMRVDDAGDLRIRVAVTTGRSEALPA